MKEAFESGKRREGVTLLDQYTALQQLVQTLEGQRDLAEHRAEFFAAMADTIAKQAKLSEDEISEIRRKVRAEHEAEPEAL